MFVCYTTLWCFCSKETGGATAMTQNGERVYTVRNYTIVGNFKVGFPQWRVMRCQYPDNDRPVLKAGDEVFVLGRSQKRGFLIIEHSGRQIHMPHNYTELRVGCLRRTSSLHLMFSCCCVVNSTCQPRPSTTENGKSHTSPRL